MEDVGGGGHVDCARHARGYASVRESRHAREACRAKAPCFEFRLRRMEAIERIPGDACQCVKMLAIGMSISCSGRRA